MANLQLLSDQTASDSLVMASSWITAMLSGSLATTVAVIGIAWLGILALSGRISVRQAGLTILGCFLIFGASQIAAGLQSVIGSEHIDTAPTTVAATPPSPAPPPPPYDPYAGASVPIR